MLSYENLWVGVVLSDAREDGARLAGTIVKCELEQFITLLDRLHFKHSSGTDVKALEVLERNIFLDGLGAPVAFGFSTCNLFVFLLDASQTVELRLDVLVFKFLEEKYTFAKLMTNSEEVGTSKFLPLETFHAKHLAEFLGREWQERLEYDGQVGRDLETEVENGTYTLHIGLCNLPRFGVGEVLVADASQFHCLLLCIAELEVIEEGFNTCFHILEVFECLTVIIGEFATGWNLAFEVLLGKFHRTVDEVAEDGNELVVVAGLIVAPGEIVVFCFRCIGCEDIAKHILFAWHIDEIFVEPDGPVARGRNLVTFEVEEFVGRYIVGKDIVAVSLEHSWEDDAVENDVILANEVNKASVFILPPLLPWAVFLRISIAEFLGIGDISDRCIEPYVKDLAFGSFDGNRDTPVEVTSDRTRFQTAIEPRLALSVNVGTPFLVLVENPFAEPAFMFIEGQIPVFGHFLDEWIAVDSVVGIDEFFGRERCTALLTLITVCAKTVAAWALAANVAIGEELVSLFVVELFGSLFDELALVIEFAEEIGCKLMMDFRRGTRINIKRDAKIGE